MFISIFIEKAYNNTAISFHNKIVTKDKKHV